MDNDDVLKSKDIVVVREWVVKERRRVLSAAAITPIFASLFVWLLVYYLKSHNASMSTLGAIAFLLLGVPVFVHWWRHYRSILRQLDLIAQRVASGETVYGSKVEFHSYRRAVQLFNQADR
ncbi:hypothetical protein [Dokdonella sp.]|uniref:hypothetical protein n=2 Tax=Dokdonella sp. TaxID=2291710 RepID=UPI002BB134E6|nr:hypothetical protein [Dokdonella sp.]HPN78824.1 hypothetical protein [Dokdonella sp.]